MKNRNQNQDHRIFDLKSESLTGFTRNPPAYMQSYRIPHIQSARNRPWTSKNIQTYRQGAAREEIFNYTETDTNQHTLHEEVEEEALIENAPS